MKQIDERTLEYLLQNPHAAVFLFAYDGESSDSAQSPADSGALDPYTGAPLEGSRFPDSVLTSGQSLGLGRERPSLCKLLASCDPKPALLERFLSLETCDDAIEVEDVGVFCAYRSKTIQMIAEEALGLDVEQAASELNQPHVADASEATVRHQVALLSDLKAYLLDSSEKGLGVLLVEV